MMHGMMEKKMDMGMKKEAMHMDPDTMGEHCFTGPYGHKDSSIEMTSDEQMDRMKMFKGSKSVKTQWLKKDKKVQQSHEGPYSRHTGSEA